MAKWEIHKNRIAYEEAGSFLYPSAEEVFRLAGGEALPSYPEVINPDILGIRLSKLSARIRILLDFNKNRKNIELRLSAVRGKKTEELDFDTQLPDSIVMDNVWYSLLDNYAETDNALRQADVRHKGDISLSQYILLKKTALNSSAVDIEDAAGKDLSNHPVADEHTEITYLRANLYPYQSVGYKWMRFVAGENCGCILGDEMGLGKTLQVIALITDRKQHGCGPALVIAPVSLLENWRRELDKFTVGLKVLIHQGAGRTGLYTELLNYDVVIVSYGTVSSDLSLFKMIDWDILVVDEAQNIKNPGTNRTRCIKSLPRHVAIAVTGTPFENHMSDLWSLMDFIAPGCFGKLSDFEKEYPDDVYGAAALEPILTPVMIRRKVSEVAGDLPERVDVPQVLQMTDFEIQAYEKVRNEILNQYKGMNAALPMLQKLRMYCTHPYLLDESAIGDPAAYSTKYERLCELLEEIIALGEKTILFTSYNRMFDILQDDIPKRYGIQVMAINGSTPAADRQDIVDRFSGIAGSALLVLNPRAAGTGLNITSATRVIHYNLEWNPSLEDQASARAYRRGQEHTVFVYRLYYKDTVEEIINERIDKKRDMFSAAVVGTDGRTANNEDIVRALMITPGGEKDV